MNFPLFNRPTPETITPGDGSGIGVGLRRNTEILQRANEDRIRSLEAVKILSERKATPTRRAQIGFNPSTGKYLVAGQEFDATDPAVIQMLAEEVDSLPEQELAPGYDALSHDDIKRRWQTIKSNVEVDLSPTSRFLGMVENVGSIVPGVAGMFGYEVDNPLKGIGDGWRRKNLNIYERAGRMEAPTESLVGFANAVGQGIESGVPVLLAAAGGTLAGGPKGGIAAGVAAGGAMAAGSQAEEARARIREALEQYDPADLAMENEEYAKLRRAGYDDAAAKDELVRRATTAAAWGGFAVGGAAGALAGPLGRQVARLMPGVGARKYLGDEAADNFLRLVRGKSTGTVARLRGATGLGGVTAVGEGGQEWLETDIAQGLADVSAGVSNTYQFGAHGTLDDFVGGIAGGGPLGAIAGLRNPGPRTMSKPAPAPAPGGQGDTDLLGDTIAPKKPPSEDDIRAAISEALPAAKDQLRRLDQFISDVRTDPSLYGYTDEQLARAIEFRDTLAAEVWDMEQRLGPVPEPEYDPRQPSMYFPAPGPSAPVMQGDVGDMFGAQPRVPPMRREIGVNALGAMRRASELGVAARSTEPLFYGDGVPSARAMNAEVAGLEGLAEREDFGGGPGATQDVAYEAGAPVTPTKGRRNYKRTRTPDQAANTGQGTRTMPQPAAQIAREVENMLDPATPRDAVFTEDAATVPPNLPDDVKVVTRKGVGTLITKNPSKAAKFRRMKVSEKDTVLADILGFPQGKAEVMERAAKGDAPVAVQAVNQAGELLAEAVASESKAGKTAKKLKATTKAAATRVTTLQEALADRAEQVAEAESQPVQGASKPKRNYKRAGAPAPTLAPGLGVVVGAKTATPPTPATTPAQKPRPRRKSESAESDDVALGYEPAGRSPGRGEVQRPRPTDTKGTTTKKPQEDAKTFVEDTLNFVRELERSTPDDMLNFDEYLSLSATEAKVTGDPSKLSPEQQREFDLRRKRVENLGRLLACLLR